LFVFDDGETVEEVIKQIDEFYPDWAEEYNEPKYIRDNDDEDIDTYLEFTDLGYMLPSLEQRYYNEKHGLMWNMLLQEDKFDKNDSFASNYAKELGGTPEEIFENWNKYWPFYMRRDPSHQPWVELTEYGHKLYKEKYGDKVLLWSKGTNPSYDSIDTFESLALHIHLG